MDELNVIFRTFFKNSLKNIKLYQYVRHAHLLSFVSSKQELRDFSSLWSQIGEVIN